MSIGAYYAEVAVEGLAYHFDAVYSYIIPLDLEKRAMAGCRVMVPFGNGNRKKQGLILSVKPLLESENRTRLKSLIDVLDKEPLFDDEMLSLVFWLKETTFCTLFEAAKAMLPAGIGLSYVVSYMANNISESEISKFDIDEMRIYNYLKDKCKYVKKEKIISDLGLDSECKLFDRLVKNGVLLTNVDAKRKTGDLTVKNVRLAIDETCGEAILGTLTAKQKSVVPSIVFYICQRRCKTSP